MQLGLYSLWSGLFQKKIACKIPVCLSSLLCNEPTAVLSFLAKKPSLSHICVSLNKNNTVKQWFSSIIHINNTPCVSLHYISYNTQLFQQSVEWLWRRAFRGALPWRSTRGLECQSLTSLCPNRCSRQFDLTASMCLAFPACHRSHFFLRSWKYSAVKYTSAVVIYVVSNYTSLQISLNTVFSRDVVHEWPHLHFI